LTDAALRFRLSVHKPSKPVAKSGNAPGSGICKVCRLIVESAAPALVAMIVYRCVTEFMFPEAAIAAATLVPIVLNTVAPSGLPGVVNRPSPGSIKVCSITCQPAGNALDVNALVHELPTSVLCWDVTKTLRVPGPDAILSEVVPSMSGNGVKGLPKAVIWFAVNTPKFPSDANDAAPTVGPATATGAPAPTPIPIVIVAEFAVEAQRKALAIPAKARRFAFMSIIHMSLSTQYGTVSHDSHTRF
jgi:hypothetical protein